MTNADAVTRLNAALEGRYEIERKLGEGGMATVYLADDIRHQRKVALKVLKPGLAATIGPDRFLQEVRVTANLQHPHVLPLFDSGEADGFLFYVMPFLDGESVRERLAREGALPVTEALMILREVVDALSAAHRVGVVHRDIKPDNVMLTGRHAVVTDFGVAKAVSEGASLRTLPTAGVASGTPAYMAPEQAVSSDHVDHRTDIYAAGAMGYELLAGRPPFSGRPVQQILLAHITEPPRDVAKLRASVPAGVAALIMRCLEKQPADRWQTADELLAQLDTLAPQTAGAIRADTPPVRTGPGVPMWLKVAAPASLIVLAGAVWFGGLGGVGERGETESSISSSAAIDEIMSHERLIVMPLVNLTGEPEDDVWSMLAAEWIGKAIDRSRPIDVIPAATVRDALKVLGDSGSVSAVANRVAASHAIAGTLARTGDQVRFQIELLDARTLERLRTLDPVVGSVDAVEATVGRLADDAAVAAVVVLSPRTSIESRIRSMPPSIEAYRQVVLTGDLFCENRYREAIEAGIGRASWRRTLYRRFSWCASPTSSSASWRKVIRSPRYSRACVTR